MIMKGRQTKKGAYSTNSLNVKLHNMLTSHFSATMLDPIC